ncbi:MAG: hypothetical protein Q3989_07010, partial [Eubacteriales bacterium]|nr:hypothetical protein [Eubacteriales bacterium]
SLRLIDAAPGICAEFRACDPPALGALVLSLSNRCDGCVQKSAGSSAAAASSGRFRRLSMYCFSSVSVAGSSLGIR